MKLKLLLIALLALFAVSCGDNMLEDVADDGSSTADAEALQIALDDRNFDYVIGKLANDSVTDYNYDHLSIGKRKILASAWLGKSGFVAADSLEMMMGDNDDEAVKFLVSAQADSNDITQASTDDKAVYYKQIMGMYRHNPANATEPSLVMASGFASAMYTVMSTLGAASAALGGAIDIDNITALDIDNANISAIVADLKTNIDLIEGVRDIIDDPDTEAKFQDFLDDLGTMSDTEIKAAIKKGLGL